MNSENEKPEPLNELVKSVSSPSILDVVQMNMPTMLHSPNLNDDVAISQTSSGSGDIINADEVSKDLHMKTEGGDVYKDNQQINKVESVTSKQVTFMNNPPTSASAKPPLDDEELVSKDKTPIPESSYQARNKGDDERFHQAHAQLNQIHKLNSGEVNFGARASSNANQNIYITLPAGASVQTPEKGPRLKSIVGNLLRDSIHPFVTFDGYSEFNHILQHRCVLILQSTDNDLTEETALHLIYENLNNFIDLEVFPAYYVSLRHDLHDFTEGYPNEIPRGAYFLASKLPRVMFDRITRDDIKRLCYQLEQHDHKLIITLKSDEALPTHLRNDLPYSFIKKPPNPQQIILRWIEYSWLNTDRNNRQQLIDLLKTTTEDTWKYLLKDKQTIQEVRQVAEELCLLWRHNPSDDLLKQIMAVGLYQQVGNWFETNPEWDLRAYIIALAVLDGAEPRHVYEGYRGLCTQLKIEPRTPDTLPPLKIFMASNRREYMMRKNGLRGVEVVGFDNPALYGLILDYVWSLLRQTNDPRREGLKNWLIIDLCLKVEQDNSRMSALAARAVGTLFNRYYGDLEDELFTTLMNELTGIYSQQIYKEVLERSQLQAMNVESIENAVVAIKKMREIFEKQQKKSITIQALRFAGSVVGNILAYGIGTGNEETRREILEAIATFSDISKKLVEQKNLLDQVQSSVLNDRDRSLQKLIEVESQHEMELRFAIAFYFFVGGNLTKRAWHNLKNIAEHYIPAITGTEPIAGDLHAAIMGTIISRIAEPGDPRPIIEEIFETLESWITRSNKKHLKHLGMNLFMQLSLRITEPYHQVSKQLQQKTHLITIPDTDWTLTLFLAYNSDKIERHVTIIFRYLLNDANQPWDSVADYRYAQYLQYALNRTSANVEKEPWTVHDQGYALLEYWMLYYAEPQEGNNGEIRPVKNNEKYADQIKRIFILTLAYIPSEKIRQRMLIRLKKMVRDGLVVAIAREVMNFIENHTDKQGRAI